jgi:leader peptidase (prepilin peptidase)/N-methyltransferase
MEPFLFDEPLFRGVIGLVLGLVLGSFLTMLTYRVPRGLSIVSPPSSCPRCHSRLQPRDLVPVFSWLINRGRCRYCQTPMSLRYAVIESVTAAITTSIIIFAGLSWMALAGLCATLGLIYYVVIRLEKGKKQP